MKGRMPSRIACCVSEIDAPSLDSFPSFLFSQNGPRRPGFASPRLAARPGRLRAVLTNTSQQEGKGINGTLRSQGPFGMGRTNATDAHVELRG
jgi:hypothetical protein